MKKFIVLFCFAIISGSTTAQTLTFKFANPHMEYFSPDNYFVFDVLVKADASGSYLYGSQINCDITIGNVNTSIAPYTVLHSPFDGTYTYDPPGPPPPVTVNKYTIVSQNWNSSKLYVSINHTNAIDSYYPGAYCAITTSYQILATIYVTLQSSASTSTAGLSFFAAGMNGQQFKATSTFPYNTLYNSPNVYDNSLSNIYYGRIFCAGAYDIYAIGPWTQWGGTLNWSSSVNTSVWDTTTSAATIDNTGSLANALRIHAGARLKIKAGKDLTCASNTEINEPRGLWIESTSAGTGSFIDNGTITYPNSSSARVERYLSACDVNQSVEGCWHYVSIPVTSALTGVFLGDYMKTWDEVTGLWSDYVSGSYIPMNVSQGYAISRPSVNADTKIFTGSLNTALPAIPLTRHPGNTSNTWNGTGGWGYNLIGNSYPSAIDIDNSNIVWTNVDPMVWYYNQAGKTYLVYPVGGTGATGSRYIPAMQGIFVHVPDPQAAGSVTFPNASRSNSATTYYKEMEAPNDVDVLYLKAQGNGRETYDILSVILRDYATINYDNLYDASKLSGGAESPQLYTVTPDEATLTINTLPYTGKTTTVPLNFMVFQNGTGSYSLTASNLQSFNTGTTIFLEDKKLNQTQELTVNPVYVFNYTDGDNSSRFMLHFFNPSFGINEAGNDNSMLIYSYGHDVYLKDLTGHPEKGDFYLYDMLGQKIAQKPVADITLNKYTFNLQDGYYIVRVITKNNTQTCKVYLD
jgi:hypothetical protein